MRLGGSQENPKETHCVQQYTSTTLGVQYENSNMYCISKVFLIEETQNSPTI